MNIDKTGEEVFCHICGKWINIRGDIYLNDTQVKCLACDALLGYTHDLPEIFDE